MADIIPFAPRPVRAGASLPTMPMPAAGNGTILFFTGIRWERPDDASSRRPGRPVPPNGSGRRQPG